MPKEQITQNFTRHANTYDAYASVQREVAGRLAELLPDRGISSILEIGCGTGIYTEMLKKKYPSSRIMAIDISPGMIDAARARFDGSYVDFDIRDGQDYEPRARYDLVTSNATLHWFSDIEDAVKRYSASLTGGGSIAFSIFGPETFRELAGVVLALYPGAGIASANFPDKKTVRSVLERSLSDVHIKGSLVTHRLPSFMDLLKNIKYTGVRGGDGERPFVWTRKSIADAEALYLEKHGAIDVTYQVFYCIGAV